MADPLLPQILPVSASSLDSWLRCPRDYRNKHLLSIPESDQGPSADHGLLVHDLLRHLHRQGSCRDAATVDDVLVANGLDRSGPMRAIIERHSRRCPVEFEYARHEFDYGRFHRYPPPMFMATGRIDAIWVYQGLLDVRDYKTGRLYGDRVADDRSARLQAWLLAPLATRRGLQLRVRYEYLSAEVAEDPEPFEPDGDDLDAIEEELRAVAEAICRERVWKGVADPEVCGRCRYRSICPDSSAPSEPLWPRVADPVGGSVTGL